MAERLRRRREHWAGLGAVMAAVAIVVARLWPVPDSIDAERTVLEAILDEVEALEGLRERLERERSELWQLVDVETAPD